MNAKKLKKSAAIITGTIVAGSFSGNVQANEADLFGYRDLGSGAELRSELLDLNSERYKTFEMKCGAEKKEKSEKKGEKKAEGKSAEAKCGEGKCGGDDKKAKKEAKNAEAKCGEGKCGGDDKKADTTKKKQDKAVESKCGQGKCGVE